MGKVFLRFMSWIGYGVEIVYTNLSFPSHEIVLIAINDSQNWNSNQKVISSNEKRRQIARHQKKTKLSSLLDQWLEEKPSTPPFEIEISWHPRIWTVTGSKYYLIMANPLSIFHIKKKKKKRTFHKDRLWLLLKCLKVCSGSLHSTTRHVWGHYIISRNVMCWSWLTLSLLIFV